MPKMVKIQIAIVRNDKPEYSAAMRTDGDGASGIVDKTPRAFQRNKHSANKRGMLNRSPKMAREGTQRDISKFIALHQIADAVNPENVQFHSRHNTAD